MNFDANVLRAMLRLARRRKTAEVSEVCLRVGGDAGAVRASMRRLRTAGLVELSHSCEPRLTMAGFAVAVAMLPARSRGTGVGAVGDSRAA